MSLAKFAIDSAAKEYWSQYYKEYGKSWVRDIPRRVKKAMITSKKVAKVAANFGVVTPVGTAITEEGVALEGMFRSAANENFIFYAEFDHEGQLTRFDSAKLA